jgi:hypothetical protein
VAKLESGISNKNPRGITKDIKDAESDKKNGKN